MAEIDPTVDPAAAIAEANWLLQAVSDGLKRTVNDGLRLRFPRGFLKTAEEHRRLYPFVRKPLLRRNLGYSFMLAEVYLWILFRTDLAGTPRDVVVKAALVLQGAIAEALLVDSLATVMGKRGKFKTRTRRLHDIGIIDSDLQAELDWLWDMRNQQHLYELDVSEFSFYERGDVVRATKAVGRLMEALRARSP